MAQYAEYGSSKIMLKTIGWDRFVLRQRSRSRRCFCVGCNICWQNDNNINAHVYRGVCNKCKGRRRNGMEYEKKTFTNMDRIIRYVKRVLHSETLGSLFFTCTSKVDSVDSWESIAGTNICHKNGGRIWVI